MKNTLLLSSTEDSIFKIVSLCSGLNYNQLRSNNRREELVIARKILSMLLVEEGVTIKRVGECLGKHHATVIHYKKNHKHSLQFYKDYKDLWDACKDEYYTSYREAKVEHMEVQIQDLQRSIKKLKRNLQSKPIIN